MACPFRLESVGASRVHDAILPSVRFKQAAKATAASTWIAHVCKAYQLKSNLHNSQQQQHMRPFHFAFTKVYGP
uniref:Uncharacterized protein n=1 Tax=Arundo donax TaxID=35708 RepID=A0A0A9GTD2_ARUDO